jgi:apolipoprotein N-acyltransferase
MSFRRADEALQGNFRTKRWQSRRIAFLAAGILALPAFPPLRLFFFAWFALVPLMLRTRGLSFSQAFRSGWWGGLVFNAGLLYWVALNSGADGILAPLSFLGMLLIFPLYWSLFTGFWSLIQRKFGDEGVLFLPFVWVGLEVVKNAPEIGFPWQEMGLTQIAFLPAAQIAEFGGIHLVSFWVVAVNAAIFLMLVRRRKSAMMLFLLLVLSVFWGAWRMGHLPEGGETMRALLVQGNVDPESKWKVEADSSIVLYESLTRAAIQQAPADLVLWPETAIPVYLGHQYSEQSRLRRFAREIGAPILTGAPHYEFKSGGGHDRFNSAFFFPADGSPPQRYDKIRLVPFGERVPFQRWFPVLGELNLGQAEFTPGKQYSLFTLRAGMQISAQICFESVFGAESAHFVREGATILCNLTNDGWYGNSSGPYQHAALTRFRSIETRRPLIRCANTGISLVVDRGGRVIARIPYGVRDTLSVAVQSGGKGLTFYARHGEFLPQFIAFAGAVVLGIALVKRRVAAS